MKEIYEASAKIQIRWLEKFKLLSNDSERDEINKVIGIIDRIKKIKPSANIPESSHFQVGESFTPTIYDEIFNINSMGDEYICSTSEALIKCNGLKRLYDPDFKDPSYFRGEHKFERELISKFGRDKKIDWKNTNLFKVTNMELEVLAEFQGEVKTKEELRKKIFGESEMLDDNDAGWWSIMQHYDEKNGTRMIDVTSSLFCALYFACADWNGEFHSSLDGKLYFFPKGISRGEIDNPERFQGSIIDNNDQRHSSKNDYYTIEDREDIPRFRKSSIRNDRALSQDGLFIWQPKFDLPLMLHGMMFAFRIHRDFKESILKELLSMGYTKERILSEDRFYKFSSQKST